MWCGEHLAINIVYCVLSIKKKKKQYKLSPYTLVTVIHLCFISRSSGEYSEAVVKAKGTKQRREVRTLPFKISHWEPLGYAGVFVCYLNYDYGDQEIDANFNL